ncbi:MAG: hypothetical protein M1359_10095 [Betaproteobacteria bacterium]|nr:hypothetical protein [Betaproteobacteria bacterium]
MLERTIERWFDEAYAKGYREGCQEGLLLGYLEVLTVQLRLRFGTMPDWVEARLSEASDEQLMGWMGRILTATSLPEVFGQSDQGALL